MFTVEDMRNLLMNVDEDTPLVVANTNTGLSYWVDDIALFSFNTPDGEERFIQCDISESFDSVEEMLGLEDESHD